MMLGTSPRALLQQMGRPFTWQRPGGVPAGVPVIGFLRGIRAAELVNSDLEADALVVVDAAPLAAAGVEYLLKFDRLVSATGEAYTVEASRVAFDGTAPVFHKAYVRGGTIT